MTHPDPAEPGLPDDYEAEYAAYRAGAASTVEPGLRALFARYIEHHGEPAEWDTDDGWCQKHLPRIEEVRAALTPDETA